MHERSQLWPHKRMTYKSHKISTRTESEQDAEGNCLSGNYCTLLWHRDSVGNTIQENSGVFFPNLNALVAISNEMQALHFTSLYLPSSSKYKCNVYNMQLSTVWEGAARQEEH